MSDGCSSSAPGEVIDFHHPPTSSDPDVLFSILDRQCALYLPEAADRSLLARVYARAAQSHAGVKRDSGEPYVTHPLHVALILAFLQLDLPTLAAALLHDVLEDTPATAQDLAQEFGVEIANLVDGVTKLGQMGRLSRSGQSAANVQKVVMAMSEDIRVIFIKLADRLHNLRTLHFKESAYSRERSAVEALEVYARIADRLGIAILRKEMEDIAFSYLNPAAYERVKASIEARYSENAELVEAIQGDTLALLEQWAIHTAGTGVQPNPRRAYDMYRRLQEEANPPPGRPKRVPPFLRFHVIVEDVPSCYMAMAAIHAKWPPIASETRDYISAPLPNGYQSLHTTVFIDQQPIKFQIRTALMHRTSQLGIIAYMQEGEWPTASAALKQTVDELRQFATEAVQELGEPVEFLTSLKREILGDEIYVYTPKNKVIQLPVGSTPVDFAYRIHTDVGHNCRGALVDGHWVSLSRPLRTGERVEILTVEGAGPSFEWLNPDLGYTNSPLAKSKIRRWFRRRPEREQVALGHRELRRIVDRLSLAVDDFTALAKRMGYARERELCADIGGCDLPLERVLPELLQVYGEPQLPSVCSNGTSDIPVIGVGSLEKHFAPCCQPEPDDDIVGYILAPGHVVEVHRSNCPVFLCKMVEDKTRFVEVKWGQACETYLACMEIYAHDRPFLLRDVWDVISEEGINVADVDVQVNRGRDAAITICMDIQNWLQFNSVLTRIEDLPGTIRVRRERAQSLGEILLPGPGIYRERVPGTAHLGPGGSSVP
jgi:RelA/SpoT family (p)ppGpp synthetase